jgi:hypothetical protein
VKQNLIAWCLTPTLAVFQLYQNWRFDADTMYPPDIKQVKEEKKPILNVKYLQRM